VSLAYRVEDVGFSGGSCDRPSQDGSDSYRLLSALFYGGILFAGNQLKKTIAALERWETTTPCSSEATKAQATLMLYTDGDLAESGTILKNAIKGLASVKKCFQQVSYASAFLKVSVLFQKSLKGSLGLTSCCCRHLHSHD
jgi:hypothetical protein